MDRLGKICVYIYIYLSDQSDKSTQMRGKKEIEAPRNVFQRIRRKRLKKAPFRRVDTVILFSLSGNGGNDKRGGRRWLSSGG